MPNKNLVIINNERISKNNGNFYCDNVDMKSIPEGLNENFKVTLIARKSKIERTRKINLERIVVSSNIFKFFSKILGTLKKDQTNYLIISITPYTFFAYLLLLLSRKKVFVYGDIRCKKMASGIEKIDCSSKLTMKSSSM